VTIAEDGSTQDRRRGREPTVDEIMTDPIVVAVTQADSVEPKALKRLFVRDRISVCAALGSAPFAGNGRDCGRS
jgi:hypothetical protein